MRFKSYHRDFSHHGLNEVQLLSTFLRGIALAYQMALDTASEGNFNTRNPEEAVRLIENLASCSSTKNIDLERIDSATTLWKEQMDDIKAKLDSIYKLLKNQVDLTKDREAKDDVERDVDFIRTFTNSFY